MSDKKQKLIVTRGLPGSGKTSWAKDMEGAGFKRVNKDDLRAMIDDSKYSPEKEKLIRRMETLLVREFLAGGYSVIVDATNYNYINYWKDLADNYPVKFEIKDFDTPVQECIRRNALRSGVAKVPERAIWDMYFKHVEPNIPKPEFVADGPRTYLCDLDGTIARMGDRSPYDWSRVGEDTVNENLADLLLILGLGHKIIFVSGRDEVCRLATEEWLTKNGIKFDGLVMRSRGDMRKDSIVKKELYENHIKGKYNVLGVFDDRDQVVALWRSLGLTTYQVNYGSF